jgi:hypothetical protein
MKALTEDIREVADRSVEINGPRRYGESERV